MRQGQTTHRSLLAAALCFVALAGIEAQSTLQRSVSTSRQFIVYGPDTAIRGAVCGLAEQTKASLLGLLQQSDNWKRPIVINAQYPQANLPENPAAALNLSQTGFGLKFQLDLTIGADANASAIQRELLRVLLLEMIYRERLAVPAGTQYAHLPDWLLDGLLACADPQQAVAEGNLLQSFVASNKIISLEEFLGQRPELLDSPSRAGYRAFSFALLTQLTDLPNGRALLAKFIADLPDASNDTVADLLAHFPVLGGSLENAEKEWRSRVTRLASVQSYEPLTFAETERRLAELLRLRFAEHGSEKIWALEDYAQFIRFRDRAEVLTQLSRNLMLLAGRANPIYQPIVAEYEQIATKLARGKTHGISKRLTRVKVFRQDLAAQMQKIEDYMNWFEATQTKKRSGTFAQYLKAAEKAEETGSRRRDPISVYLDSLESQFRD